jgi:phosphate starvation-inducible protein PhoH
LEVTIQLNSTDKQLELFGPADSFLRILRQSLDVQISARQGRLIIKGKEKDVDKAAKVVDKMQEQLLKRGSLTAAKVNTLIRTLDSSEAIETNK